MIRDAIIRGLIGPLGGNLKHFIAWREERWDELRNDNQVQADLSLMYFLRAVVV